MVQHCINFLKHFSNKNYCYNIVCCGSELEFGILTTVCILTNKYVLAVILDIQNRECAHVYCTIYRH